MVEARKLLSAQQIKSRIVSCPSEGLFRTQSQEYQEMVLPKGIKRFALTAGLPCVFESLAGADGYVYGLESFGYSAPYKVLDEKLGFTPENIYNEIVKFINR